MKEYAKCFPRNKNKQESDEMKLKESKLKVLIQTVNETEFYAAMLQLKDYIYTEIVVKDKICDSRSYYYVGAWGKVPVVIIQTDMSNNGIHSAWYETKKALYYMPQLKYIFSVGVCGGVAGKVNLGDVVISRAIHGYGDLKRTPAGWIDRSLLAYCNETSAFRCFARASVIAHSPVPVKPGVVMSGPWLIADTEAQKDLLTMSKEAIAFEMEGANIVQACSHTKVECMIVKGVSDLADANKSDDWQPFAATNAVKYLYNEINYNEADLFLVSQCLYVCICVCVSMYVCVL